MREHAIFRRIMLARLTMHSVIQGGREWARVLETTFKMRELFYARGVCRENYTFGNKAGA